MPESLHEIINSPKKESKSSTAQVKYSEEELLNFDFCESDTLSEESLRNLSINRAVNSITEPLFNFFSGALSSIRNLESQLVNFDNSNEYSHKLVSNQSALLKLVQNATSQVEDFEDFASNCREGARARIDQKLLSLRDPHLLLGFEYILDQMIVDRKIERETEEHNRQVLKDEFGENPDFSDVFEPEAITNINNNFGR